MPSMHRGAPPCSVAQALRPGARRQPLRRRSNRFPNLSPRQRKEIAGGCSLCSGTATDCSRSRCRLRNVHSTANARYRTFARRLISAVDRTVPRCKRVSLLARLRLAKQASLHSRIPARAPTLKPARNERLPPNGAVHIRVETGNRTVRHEFLAFVTGREEPTEKRNKADVARGPSSISPN